MSKRIILVGPAASGKDFIKKKFAEKGFISEISFTSRAPREGEVDAVDYHFRTKDDFERMIGLNLFYEWVKHGEYYYGTHLLEWENADIFIMETDGISKIKPEDRGECLIIYVDTPLITRIRRMRDDRKWDDKKILERVGIDNKKFEDFKDYDIRITSQEL